MDVIAIYKSLSDVIINTDKYIKKEKSGEQKKKRPPTEKQPSALKKIGLSMEQVARTEPYVRVLAKTHKGPFSSAILDSFQISPLLTTKDFLKSLVNVIHDNVVGRDKDGKPFTLMASLRGPNGDILVDKKTNTATSKTVAPNLASSSQVR